MPFLLVLSLFMIVAMAGVMVLAAIWNFPILVFLAAAIAVGISLAWHDWD